MDIHFVFGFKTQFGETSAFHIVISVAMFLVKRGGQITPVPLVVGDVIPLERIFVEDAGVPSKDTMNNMTWDELRFMLSRFCTKLANMTGKSKKQVVDYIHENWQSIVARGLEHATHEQMTMVPAKLKLVFIKMADGLVIWMSVGSGQVVLGTNIDEHDWHPLTEDMLKSMTIDQMKDLCYELTGEHGWDGLRGRFDKPVKVSKKEMMMMTMRCWTDYHDNFINPQQAQDESESEASSDEEEVASSHGTASDTGHLRIQDFANTFINDCWHDEAQGHVVLKVPTIVDFKMYFYYKKDTTVGDLKAYVHEMFGIEGGSYTLVIDGSYLEDYDTMSTYLLGTSKIIDMNILLKGGTVSKVMKHVMKKKPTKPTSTDEALFAEAYRTCVKVASSSTYSIKSAISEMNLPELEDLKQLLVATKSPNQSKVFKIATALKPFRMMGDVMNKISACLTSFEEMVQADFEQNISGETSNAKLEDIREHVAVSIALLKRASAQPQQMVAPTDVAMAPR